MRFVAGLLLLVCAQLAGCAAPERRPFDLVRRFPEARWQNFQTYQGNLGDDAAWPYQTSIKVLHVQHSTAKTAAGVSMELKVLAYHLHNTSVSIEGHLIGPKATSGTVSVKLNQKALPPLKLGRDWETLTFPLTGKQLKLGENLLSFTCDAPVEWRLFSIDANQIAPQQELQPDISRLSVPFDANIDYPLPPGPARSVSFEITPWTLPGSPAMAEDSWELTLEVLGSQGEVLSKSSSKTLGHFEARLDPSDEFRILTVRLSGPKPLPGQFGLALVTDPTPGPAAEPTGAPTADPYTPQPPGTKSPVVLFVIDTLRADHLESYGCEFKTSPHLKEFARDAVQYDNCMAPSPWTKPSVTTLVTGLAPEQHKVTDFASVLAHDVPTLAQSLGEAGYTSSAVWNNGLLGPIFKIQRGYTFAQITGGFEAGTAVVQRAVKTAEQHLPLDTGNWFLHLHILDPHEPYNPPAPYRKEMFEAFGLKFAPGDWGATGLPVNALRELMEQAVTDPTTAFSPRNSKTLDALYSADIKEADKAFGELVDWLKKKGLYDQALIVVTSDHGEELLDHGHLGHVTSLYQELIHVPLLIKLPNSRLKGTRVTQTCSLDQVAPTVSKLALGRSAFKREGLPLSDSTDGDNKPIYFSVDVGRDAVVTGQGTEPFLVSARGLRLGNFTYQENLASLRLCPPRALFDLANDPQETKNLVWSRPALALYCHGLLAQMQKPGDQATTLSREEQKALLKTLKSLQYVK